MIIKRRKITRSLLSRSTRWWLSLYADTSRAVYSAAWMILRKMLMRRPGRRGGGHKEESWSAVGTRAQGKQRQPWFHKKGHSYFRFFNLIKKQCRIMRERTIVGPGHTANWSITFLANRTTRSQPATCTFICFAFFIYFALWIKVLSYVLHLP